MRSCGNFLFEGGGWAGPCSSSVHVHGCEVFVGVHARLCRGPESTSRVAHGEGNIPVHLLQESTSKGRCFRGCDRAAASVSPVSLACVSSSRNLLWLPASCHFFKESCKCALRTWPLRLRVCRADLESKSSSRSHADGRVPEARKYGTMSTGGHEGDMAPRRHQCTICGITTTGASHLEVCARGDRPALYCLGLFALFEVVCMCLCAACAGL